MKLQTIFLLTFLQVAFMCRQKEEVKPSEKDLIGIDLDDPVGRCLYLELPSDLSNRFLILEFAPNNFLNVYGVTVPNPLPIPYERPGDRIIRITGGDFHFEEGGIVSSVSANFKRLLLLPEASTNQLAGKTFEGKYHRENGSVLHENYFYSFSKTGTELQAGFQVGSPVRTATYIRIGNWGAVSRVNNGDLEVMVLVDGKLEVDYYSQEVESTHTATLSEFKEAVL
jgi:hypothetical protein